MKRYRIPTAELCDQGGFSKSTAWRLSKTDKNFPKAIYIGGKKLFYQDEVTAYLESLEHSTPTHNNLTPKEQVSA